MRKKDGLVMLKLRCRKTKVYAKGSEAPALAALPMHGYLLSDLSAAERALWALFFFALRMLLYQMRCMLE
jgi:hypothetical protein